MKNPMDHPGGQISVTGAADGIVCASTRHLASIGMTFFAATRNAISSVGGNTECVTFNVAELAVASGIADQR